MAVAALSDANSTVFPNPLKTAPIHSASYHECVGTSETNRSDETSRAATCPPPPLNAALVPASPPSVLLAACAHSYGDAAAYCCTDYLQLILGQKTPFLVLRGRLHVPARKVRRHSCRTHMLRRLPPCLIFEPLMLL